MSIESTFSAKPTPWRSSILCELFHCLCHGGTRAKAACAKATSECGGHRHTGTAASFIIEWFLLSFHKVLVKLECPHRLRGATAAEAVAVRPDSGPLTPKSAPLLLTECPATEAAGP